MTEQQSWEAYCARRDAPTPTEAEREASRFVSLWALVDEMREESALNEGDYAAGGYIDAQFTNRLADLLPPRVSA